MKLILTIFTIILAFNASALSFTERMSMQNKTGLAAPAEQESTLTKEDMELGECEAPYANYAQLVQALLIIIALMATAIYFQGKKIKALTPEE